jgi:hypothetical protein
MPNAAVVCATLQALQAAHNRSLEVLAEAEARLKDEAAAKAGRDAKAQQVCCVDRTLRVSAQLCRVC